MARPLPDYYKTKGEDAPWKFLTHEFKMADKHISIIYLDRPDIR